MPDNPRQIEQWQPWPDLAAMMERAKRLAELALENRANERERQEFIRRMSK